MDEVLKSAGNLSIPFFYMCDSYAIKSIVMKTAGYLQTKKSRQEQTEETYRDEGNMDIARFSVTDEGEVISVESCATTKVCVSNINDHNQSTLFMRIKQIEDVHNLLDGARLLPTTSLCELYRIPSFVYCNGILSIPSRAGACATEVNTFRQLV